MDIISIVVLSFATIFCVMYRTEGNQVFLALLFTYILLLQDFVLWTIKCFASVEQRMVNIDRCLKMLDIPQEDLSGSNEDFFERREGWPE